MTDHAYFEDRDESQIAYIRLVDPETLPDEVREQTGGMDKIWSIHAADGQVLALVDDRRKAFAVVRMNEMTPVSVH